VQRVRLVERLLVFQHLSGRGLALRGDGAGVRDRANRTREQKHRDDVNRTAAE